MEGQLRSVDSAEARPRLRRPDRQQGLLLPLWVDDLVPADHPVRMVWRLVESWNLQQFEAPIAARGSDPGRAATDPRLLVALWLWALIDGVGSGRELARLCEESAAYRWLCGGVQLNYHTLNDFRVSSEVALDELLTRMLAALTRARLVQVKRIVQDGTRVRASAGSKSFKRRSSLERHLAHAHAHLTAVKQQALDPTTRVKAQRSQERATIDRIRRLEQALVEVEKIEAAKALQKKKPSKERPARASTTDPEARLMRMPDGGTRPAYNVQIAVDPASRAIVGVDVTHAGSDVGESEPMRRQVEARSGQRVEEQVVDGGYVGLDAIEAASSEGVQMFAPLPKSKKEDTDPHQPKSGDGPGVAAWRARMSTPEAQEIYGTRASSVERIHADLKTHRGVDHIPVRGLHKARCVALWFALAYNLKLFGDLLTVMT